MQENTHVPRNWYLKQEKLTSFRNLSKIYPLGTRVCTIESNKIIAKALDICWIHFGYSSSAKTLLFYDSAYKEASPKWGCFHWHKKFAKSPLCMSLIGIPVIKLTYIR